ncbi:MAG: hypothetical protein J5705_04505 [Bacteroidaceae bacterium]|nr:hypothetical protein [Bacteroidaceae bacterium]
MKICRIRVLMAKGWCKAVCFVSFSLLSLFCNHASAQKVRVDTIQSVDEALTGKVAGFEILFESGDLAYGPPVRSLMKNMDLDEGIDVAFSSGKHLIINKPLLVLDGNIITADSTAWAGIDLTKADYSKDELARLFDIKARKIKSVTVLKGEAATAVWGMKGWAGVIDVQTKKGYRK